MSKSDQSTSSSGWLNDTDRSKLKAVYESETACFSDLVKISGLNPSIDFRFSDLTAVDFSGSDLRGYNFAGANLSYNRWFKATWDATTNLEGALLTGAKGYVRTVTSGPPAERLIQPFFDNTPMAIATVDKAGDILRTNARFASLANSLGSTKAMDSILSAVHSQDRDVLAAALCRPLQRHNDRRPIEALLGGDKARGGQFFLTPARPELENHPVFFLALT